MREAPDSSIGPLQIFLRIEKVWAQRGREQEWSATFSGLALFCSLSQKIEAPYIYNINKCTGSAELPLESDIQRICGMTLGSLELWWSTVAVWNSWGVCDRAVALSCCLRTSSRTSSTHSFTIKQFHRWSVPELCDGRTLGREHNFTILILSHSLSTN